MNQDLLDEILRCDSLPTLPGIAVQVLELARRPDLDIREIASLIRNDPALSSKLLKTVNSSFYGLSRRVSTITQALVILGLQSVKTLALGFTLVGGISRASPQGFDHMGFWRRSIYSAISARTLAEGMTVVHTEEAFIAALLQDIGTLAMHTALGERYTSLTAGGAQHLGLLDREDQKLGLNHAEVGRVLAEDWSLPPLLSVPIGCHHDPDQAEESLQVMSRIVHLSGLFAEVFMPEEPAKALLAARARGQELFSLEPQKVDQMLEQIGRSVKEVADLFEVNIGKRVDFQRVLSQANQALLDLTLQTQQLAVELQQRNKHLLRTATTDELTALANRARLNEVLANEFRRARKFLRPLSVLSLDADGLKDINDTFGHAAGDQVLKQLGGILRDACRGIDLVARCDGDEFACVLTETDLLTASELAQSIHAAIAEEVFEHEGRRIPVTVSVGVACMSASQPFSTPEQLLNSADRAVRAAKKDGKNLVRVYAPAANKS